MLSGFKVFFSSLFFPGELLLLSIYISPFKNIFPRSKNKNLLQNIGYIILILTNIFSQREDSLKVIKPCKIDFHKLPYNRH